MKREFTCGLGSWLEFVSFVGFLFFVGFFWAGCSKKDGEEKKAEKKTEVFKDPVADDKGKYEYNRRMPDRWKCEEDIDCAYTHLRPGNCCPNQCGVNAGSRKWVLSVRRMHYPVCRPFLKKHGFDICGSPKCPPSKGIPRGQCKDGKCTVRYKPFAKGMKIDRSSGKGGTKSKGCMDDVIVEEKSSDSKAGDKKETDKKEADKKEADKKEADKKETDKKETDKKEADKKEADKKETDKKKIVQ